MPVQEIYAKFRGTMKLSQDVAPPVVQPSLLDRMTDTFKSYMAPKTGPVAAPPAIKPVETVKAPETNIEEGVKNSVPKPSVPPQEPALNTGSPTTPVTTKPVEEPKLPENPVPAQATPVSAPAPTTPATAPATPPTGGILDGIKDTANKLKETAIAGTASGTVNPLIKNIMSESKDNPNGFGITDWLTSNWGNIAVPAGILLSMFGGRTGAILGGLAMAAGGYNLYNRYQTLMSKEAQPELQKYIASKFDPKVLAQIQQTNPALGQAATDLRGAIHYGFATDVIKKIQEGGEAAIKGFKMDPTAEARVLEQYRTGTQADTTQLPGRATWGSTAKNYVGGLYDQGKAKIQGMMQ